MTTVNVSVTVLSVDAGCDACGASLSDVPVEVACRWLEAHREPALAAIETNLGRWERL